MAHHVLQMADGTVAIMQTVAEPDGSEPGVEECLAKWHPDEAAKVQAHAPVDPATLPTDRTFRNAWRHDGTAFAVDMDHARAIHKDRMRGARGPLLAALDVAWDKATEADDADAKATVRTEKQALRDVTADPGIAAATSPDELKAAWPAVLGAAGPRRRP